MYFCKQLWPKRKLAAVSATVAIHSHLKAGNKNASRVDEMNINSSAPSAAYMRQWIGSVLVQIMARCLFGAKLLSKPMPGYCKVTIRNTLRWNFNQNIRFFTHQDASQNIVCEMAAILSRGKELIRYVWYWLPCLFSKVWWSVYVADCTPVAPFANMVKL